MSDELHHMGHDPPLPARKLAMVRQALYDAKFALEQETRGEDKDAAIQAIMRALDLTVDPYVDAKPMTDERLAVFVAEIRALPTQGAAERAAVGLVEGLITPSMTKALAMQDEAHKRLREMDARIAQLEEELMTERRKVARLATRGK